MTTRPGIHHYVALVAVWVALVWLIVRIMIEMGRTLG